jgi:glycosyltransferase involved in cell wall biosynthesis
MKVALVLTQDRGGPVDLTVALALEMASRSDGPEVTIIGPEPVSSAGDAGPLLRPLHVRSKTDLISAWHLRSTIEKLEPHIVHAQDRRAGLMTTTVVRPRVPVLSTYHGIPETLVGRRGGTDDAAERWPSPGTVGVLAADATVARLATTTVAPSEAMARFLRRRLRVPEGKLRVIANGVVLPPPRPLTTTARVFTYVGVFSPRKAVTLLVDAFAEVARTRSQVRLRLVGDGDERAACERMAERAGVAERVVFTGYRPDVPAQLALADAFVLPSLEENLPLALLEAMGAGLACVATGVGGVPEALSDCGLVVPPGDRGSLVAAMTRLADEEGLAPRLGGCAAELARRSFSIAVCADAHLALWRETTGRH